MLAAKTGFILIDKPLGPSSHTVVNRLRGISGFKKIGHAGTLDPLASGLLLLAIGREYTKKLGGLIKLDKEYWAEIYLGATSDTYDREGKVSQTYIGKRLSRSLVKKTLKNWEGEVKQKPPIFSAKKINGRKLYQLARQGKKIEIEPRLIKIYKIKILKYRWPILKIRINCASGTYIRSLAHDLGADLGCGAYLYNLRRTKIGQATIKKAIKLDKLTVEKLSKRLKTAL
ncbi:MAG: tRNA pseudouridine(55) synthase TruB [Candidatus Falkowbacteria bacterium]|nr:tRNA pseudouridine(55) synthase TruB [Candidatus Falkowbacteria bacterium]